MGMIALLWYAAANADPVSKKEELEIKAQCAGIFIMMGCPFFCTTYTAIRFISLPMKDVSTKFSTFIKVRQYSFIPTDLIFVVALTQGDELATIWLICGVIIIF